MGTEVEDVELYLPESFRDVPRKVYEGPTERGLYVLVTGYPPSREVRE